MGVVNHEENERGWDGLYLDSLISDHFLAYVVGPRFENPIFYSVLRSNTNRNYSFSRIGDAKSSKLTNGYTVTSRRICQATYFPNWSSGSGWK